MEKELSNFVAIVEKHKDEVMRLAVYIPWLESSQGNRVSQNYDSGGALSTTITFPVYDSNLMRFVKEARKTELMNKNYAYVYSRYRIRSAETELKLIESATMKEFDLLAGILSRYVMLGMTKGAVWSEGVTNGVFLQVLSKMKELIEFWGQKQECRNE